MLEIRVLPELNCDERQRFRIATLGEIVPPAGLEGLNGRRRIHRDSGQSEQTDLEVVQMWIAASDERGTAEARRRLAERLLNWAYLERKKALSDLEPADLYAFMRFLANPTPSDVWICARGCRRASPQWRPFHGGLGPQSRRHAASILSTLVDFLSHSGHSQTEFRHGRRSLDHCNVGCYIAAHTGREEACRGTLAIAEWHWIQSALDRMDIEGQEVDKRLAIELLYFGALHLKEIASLTADDVYPPSRRRPCWILKIVGRPVWRGGEFLAAPPPLASTLKRWWDESRCKNAAPHAMLLEHNADWLGVATKAVVRLAAEIAEAAAEPVLANCLRSRTAISLRHALQAHSRTTSLRLPTR